MTFEEMKMKAKSFDYLLLFLVCILAVFGIVLIGSSTHVNILGKTDEHSRQQLFFISGLVLLLIVSFIDHKFIAKFYIVAYVVNIALLILVLILVKEDKSTARQLEIPGGFMSIQPSEFAKLFMLIFVSKFVDKYNERVNNIFTLMILGVLIIVPVYLVNKQPSLSASLAVLATSLAIVFLGGLSYKYIAGAFAIGVPLAIVVIQDILRPKHLFVNLFLQEYQIQDRIMPFLRPETAPTALRYQTTQSVAAIASGQLLGQGLYQGNLTSLGRVPYNYNDFILAVVGEEFGFVGCVFILFIMLIIIVKCLLIAQRADSLYGKLIASGVAFAFAFQTFVNVGVATDILPNTGMSLPFVSYGGSAMWINMICVGLVINVGMRKPKSFFEE